MFHINDIHAQNVLDTIFSSQYGYVYKSGLLDDGRIVIFANSIEPPYSHMHIFEGDEFTVYPINTPSNFYLLGIVQIDTENILMLTRKGQLYTHFIGSDTTLLANSIESIIGYVPNLKGFSKIGDKLAVGYLASINSNSGYEYFEFNIGTQSLINHDTLSGFGLPADWHDRQYLSDNHYIETFSTNQLIKTVKKNADNEVIWEVDLMHETPLYDGLFIDSHDQIYVYSQNLNCDTTDDNDCAILTCIDASGNELWEKEFTSYCNGPPDCDVVFIDDVIEVPGGDILLGGSKGQSYYGPVTHVYFKLFDKQGNDKWGTNIFISPEGDFLTQIYQADNGIINAVGVTNVSDVAGFELPFVIQLDLTTAIYQTQNSHTLSLSPNPSDGLFKVSGIPEDMILNMKLLDIHGKVLDTRLISNRNQIHNYSYLEPGTYFIKLGTDVYFKSIKWIKL